MRTCSATVWWLIASVVYGLSAPLHAAEVVFAEVSYQAPAYKVSFDVVLEAAHGRVQGLVRDYANLSALSPTITHSEVLETKDGSIARVKLVLRPCVWFVFCKRMTKVTDIRVSDRDEVIHVTVPELSDFHEARERLSIEPDTKEQTHTKMSYRARLVPKFLVPPIIGPWIIKRQIIKELTLSARRVEQLARDR